MIKNVRVMEQYPHSGVFTVNFKQISHLFSSVSIADFEKVNGSWGLPTYGT